MSLFAKLTSTTLKSLKFGQTGTEGDSTAPYIVTNINNSDSYLNNRYSNSLALDSLTIRGNKIGARYASTIDTIRISKFLIDPLKGPFFLYNQIGLQKSNPRIGYSKYVKDNPKSDEIGDSMRSYSKLGTRTLAQISKTAYGEYIPRHGDLFSPPGTYEQIMKLQEGNDDYEKNRLYMYYSTLFSNATPKNIKYANKESIVDEYEGGPNSTYGIGKTTLYRTVYSGDLGKIEESLERSNNRLKLFNYEEHVFYKNYYGADEGINNPTVLRIVKKDKVYKTIQESFDGEIKKSNNITPVSQSAPPTYINYKGNPEKTTEKEVEAFNKKKGYIDNRSKESLGYNRSKGTTYSIYEQGSSSSEGIKVIFKQINPFDGEYDEGKRIEFSSYINGYNESYSSNWNEIKYNGRNDFLYNFVSYKKTVSFNLQIPIFRVEDLKPTHNKLKTLQKGLAGRYNNRRLGGIITYINLGYYLNNQPCIINSLNIKIPDEASWDWGVPQNDKNTFLAYSTLLEASFNITTIGDEKGSTPGFGDEGVGYDDKLKDDLFKSTLPDLTGIDIIQR
jgi:hypothetical protein